MKKKNTCFPSNTICSTKNKFVWRKKRRQSFRTLLLRTNRRSSTPPGRRCSSPRHLTGEPPAARQVENDPARAPTAAPSRTTPRPTKTCLQLPPHIQRPSPATRYPFLFGSQRADHRIDNIDYRQERWLVWTQTSPNMTFQEFIAWASG